MTNAMITAMLCCRSLRELGRYSDALADMERVLQSETFSRDAMREMQILKEARAR